MIPDLQSSIDHLALSTSHEEFERVRAILEAQILRTHDATLLARLSMVYRDKGLWQSAEDILRQAIRDEPSNPNSYQALALVYLRRDDMKDSDAYEYAREAMETCLRLEQLGCERSPVAHTLLGRVYELLGDERRAKEEYLLALDIDAAYSEARFNLAMLTRGYDESSHDVTIELLIRCVTEDPAYFIALKELGWELLASGRPVEAKVYLDRALKLDANDLMLRVYLGQLHWTIRENGLAEEHFLAAIKLDPGFPDAHRLLGKFYRYNDQVREANQELFAAVELDSSRQESIRAYSEFLRELEDRDVAAELYSSAKALSALPKSDLQRLDVFFDSALGFPE